jgi:hypothetical protein
MEVAEGSRGGAGLGAAHRMLAGNRRRRGQRRKRRPVRTEASGLAVVASRLCFCFSDVAAYLYGVCSYSNISRRCQFLGDYLIFFIGKLLEQWFSPILSKKSVGSPLTYI